MLQTEPKKVYMVVVLRQLKHPLGCRTWGWYSDFDTAEKCVLENWTDLFERGHYEYAVVEEAYEGMCNGGMRSEATWYKAIYLDDSINHEPKIVKIDKPKELKNIVHFW